MFAIVSDIHGNLEAFTAVLGEIERRGDRPDRLPRRHRRVRAEPDRVPRPGRRPVRGVADGEPRLRRLFEPFNFNAGAEQACYWSRQQFEDDPDADRRADRWRFLGNLPARIKTPEFVAVHASPRRPINEYIFPDDIYTNPGKFVSIFERFEKLCFVGHTHVPGVFLEGPDFYSPDELDYRFELTDEKAIINVGSVGQPRDRDPRSSFVIVTDTAVEFVRLPYDVEAVVAKVEQIPELDNFLGTRLRDGR